MHDAELVNGPQPVNRLDQDSPHLTFSEVHFPAPSFLDHLEQVSAVRELHDKIQSLRVLINESLLIGNDIRVINARQNPDFINSVFFILVTLRSKSVCSPSQPPVPQSVTTLVF